MLSPETIGMYSDEPGSQSYPFSFGFFYPSTVNSDMRAHTAWFGQLNHGEV